MAEPLPEYKVRACNTSTTSENKIHDDAVARRYGFTGGLVPGVTVYAYLTHPLAEALGAPWLARGTANVRFVKPVFHGEEMLVTGDVTARAADGLTARVRATTAASGECAVLEATLPAGLPTPVNGMLYREAALPAERPPASRALFEKLEPLGTPQTLYDAASAAEYLERVSDTLPMYRSTEGWVHPAFLLQQSNRALSLNARLGPWIHVGSRVRHLGGARVGEPLATRGRVRSLYERKGREYVELDLLIVNGATARPVAHVFHTAIYRLPEPAA